MTEEHTTPIDILQSETPELEISTDPSVLESYGLDWTRFYTPQASAVAFPRTIEQVQALVVWAQANRIGLVPSGGRTGLSGAACALNGEVVVSFDRMNRILELDSVDRLVTCQPGVVTEQLQTFAKENGLFYPVDFAAKVW